MFGPRPAGNFSIWLAVRNRGTLPLQYEAAANGSWTLIPRVTSDQTNCGLLTPDPSLVRVMNIHRYNVSASAGCNNHIPCQNLRDALVNLSWVPHPTTVANDSGPILGWYDESSDVTLQGHQFVIYRVDLQLSENAGNCYQGATYTYDLVGQAKQVGAPIY